MMIEKYMFLSNEHGSSWKMVNTSQYTAHFFSSSLWSEMLLMLQITATKNGKKVKKILRVKM